MRARYVGVDHYKKKVNKKQILKDIVFIYFISLILVLLLNSLLIQAFLVPTNSMEPQINGKSRIVVNKFVYGPMYPFTNKKIFDSTHNIRRGDIVVFMSKEYYSKNIFFRVTTKFVYTLSLSLIDLSNIIKHFDKCLYVKRVIGLSGDTIKYEFTNNKLITLIKPKGEKYFIPEENLIRFDYQINNKTKNENDRELIEATLPFTEYIVKNDEYYVLGDNRIISEDSRLWGNGIFSKQIIGKAILQYWPKIKILK